MYFFYTVIKSVKNNECCKSSLIPDCMYLNSGNIIGRKPQQLHFKILDCIIIKKESWCWNPCECIYVTFRPSDPLTHVVVSSNFLVMAMSNNLLLRLDLEHPDQQEGQSASILYICLVYSVVYINIIIQVKFNCWKSTV